MPMKNKKTKMLKLERDGSMEEVEVWFIWIH